MTARSGTQLGRVASAGDLPQRRFLPGLVLVAAFTAAVVAVGLVGAPRLVVVVGAGILVIALSVLDLRLLPAAALALFALVPIGSLPVPSNNGAYNPALLAGVVLIVRCTIRACPVPSRVTTGMTLLSGLVVVVLTLVAPARLTSAAWSVNYLVLVIAVALLVPGIPGAIERVQHTWAGLGAVLGLFAVGEFVSGTNPLGRLLYRSGADPGSAAHRVSTTLGNPVLNGLFFATATMVALNLALRRPQHRWVVATLLSAFGVVGSGSRSAAGGAVVGAALLICVTAVRTPEARWRAGMAAAAGVIAAAGAYPLVARRLANGDAAGSDQVRGQTVATGLDLFHRKPWFGWGPGTADIVKRAQPVGDIQRGIESSPVQLLVSLGLVGAVLVLFVVLATLWISVKRTGEPVWAAVLVSYCAVVSTNNIIEADRSALVLLGLTIGGALASSTRWGAHDPDT